MRLAVERDGGAPSELSVRGGAAYELGMRERDHGIPIQPYPGRLGAEPLDPPARALGQVAEAVVQAVGAVLPELPRRRGSSR